MEDQTGFGFTQLEKLTIYKQNSRVFKLLFEPELQSFFWSHCPVVLNWCMQLTMWWLIVRNLSRNLVQSIYFLLG